MGEDESPASLVDYVHTDFACFLNGAQRDKLNSGGIPVKANQCSTLSHMA